MPKTHPPYAPAHLAHLTAPRRSVGDGGVCKPRGARHNRDDDESEHETDSGGRDLSRRPATGTGIGIRR